MLYPVCLFLHLLTYVVCYCAIYILLHGVALQTSDCTSGVLMEELHYGCNGIHARSVLPWLNTSTWTGCLWHIKVTESLGA